MLLWKESRREDCLSGSEDPPLSAALAALRAANDWRVDVRVAREARRAFTRVT